MKHKAPWAFYVYSALFLLLAAFVFVCGIEAGTAFGSDGGVSAVFEDGWTDSNGYPLNPSRLTRERRVAEGVPISIFAVIPEETADNSTLAFRSGNMAAEVYVNSERICGFECEKTNVLGKMSGAVWSFVENINGGDTVEIRAIPCYSDYSVYIDNVRLGDRAAITAEYYREFSPYAVLMLLTAFIGIIYMFADFAFIRIFSKKHALLYFGAFTMLAAARTVLETNGVSLFVSEPRIFPLISILALKLSVIPMLLYFCEEFRPKNKSRMNVMYALSFGDIVITSLLHLTGAADLHETVGVTYIVLAIEMVYCIAESVGIMARDSGKKKRLMVFDLGLAMLLLTACADFTAFYVFASNDTAFFSRIGILLFAIFVGIVNLLDLATVVRMGVRAKFVERLAYEDGLTGLGNTTAFHEKLDELEKIPPAERDIAIVQFDINGLKTVNDTYGHSLGDRLLGDAAFIIQKTFGRVGECYRVGGDEFTVFIRPECAFSVNIPDKNARVLFESALREFNALIDEYNAETINPFKMEIALGAAFTEDCRAGKPLRELHDDADAEMYRHKQEMKSMYPRR